MEQSTELEQKVQHLREQAEEVPVKTKEQLAKEQEEMERAQKKLEAETIKKVKEHCARLRDTVEDELKNYLPIADTLMDDTLLRGVVHAMGAMVHRAEDAIRQESKRTHRQLEVTCAKDLGRVMAPLNKQRSAFRDQQMKEIERLRKEKADKLREAQIAIANEYNNLIEAASMREVPEEVAKLQNDRDLVEQQFHTAVKELEDSTGQQVNKLLALLQVMKDELKATEE